MNRFARRRVHLRNIFLLQKVCTISCAEQDVKLIMHEIRDALRRQRSKIIKISILAWFKIRIIRKRVRMSIVCTIIYCCSVHFIVPDFLQHVKAEFDGSRNALFTEFRRDFVPCPLKFIFPRIIRSIFTIIFLFNFIFFFSL